MPRARALERIDWALGAVGLSDVRGKTIRSLSGGMKQRLLLAQAILDEPDILILDEPTAGLDPRQRIAVRNLIAEIALQKIVIVSTHVVPDVEYVASELLLLSEGRLLRKASPAELTHELNGQVWEAELARVRAARRAGRRDGLRHRPRRRGAYPRAPAGGKAAALCLQAACAGAGGCVSALLRRGGRAMSYELRKILGNRYVMLLLALAVAVNAALFYRRCTKDLGGFTRADVRAEYAHLDTLEQEYDALLNGIYGEDVDIMQVPDEDLRRYALLSTVRDEVETTKNYPEYLRGLCAETEAKLRLGLFSADPFAERTLEKGLAAYSALLGVRLEPSFPDGVEVLLDWRLTDLLLLLFAAVSGLVLLTGERSAGLMVLLRPTRRGHGALYWRKAAAMLATVFAGVVLLYGANLAVSAAVLGLGDRRAPSRRSPACRAARSR